MVKVEVTYVDHLVYFKLIQMEMKRRVWLTLVLKMVQ